MNRYERETDEFQPVTVTVNGEPVTTGVEFSVVRDGQRPGTWAAPMTVDGAVGVRVNGFEPGNWHVFARVTDAPEIPVISCGVFRVA